MPKDLLLEIGTEEIPARFMPNILTQLEQVAKGKMAEARISYSEVQIVGTPRRLALLVHGVADRQTDKQSENKGPSVKIAFGADGNPSKAAQGFARGQGVDVDKLVVKDDYVWAVVKEEGRPVSELLTQLLPDIISSLNFPKNMRWSDLDIRFVRPIRWLVGLFGTEIIPFCVANVHSGNTTRGHRFLSKGDIEIHSADDYFTVLTENHVMVDQNLRRKVIQEQIERLAAKQGGIASVDEDLLEEVVYLVEYPTALCGRFEEDYLLLPPEVIITPMREHQRYFPVLDQDGKLLPVFITVRNGGSDYIDIVQHGNERVLRARLADARFFFEEDKKIKLADRVEKLKTIVFQEGLGTLYDKTERIGKLSLAIAGAVQAEKDQVPEITRAAKLAKADLVTAMVYEFTELQGVMGREYARLDGESDTVAQAIFEHYLPRFAGDILPQTLAGRVISIADKIDNILATFSRGLIPTGSQDPYALRRQALGVVHTLIDARYNLSLNGLIAVELDLLAIQEEEQRQKLSAEVQEFFRLRIKNVLTEEGIRYDIVDAVMAAGTDNIYDTWLRAQALAAASGEKAVQMAVQAFVRTANLAKKANDDAAVNPELFSVDAERSLYQAYRNVHQTVSEMTEIRDYQGAIAAFTQLVEPINQFFDAVMVMDKDESIKNNRLALLRSITELTKHVADLSKVIM